MRNKLFLMISLLLSIGCSPQGAYRRPHQDEAEKIVWNTWYYQVGSAPVIEWKTEGLDCGNGNAWVDVNHDGLIGSNECVSGIFYDYLNYGVVALRDESQKFSGTAYAHELMHGFFYAIYGDGDPSHCRPAWGTEQNTKCNPNPTPSTLDEANHDLVKAGL